MLPTIPSAGEGLWRGHASQGRNQPADVAVLEETNSTFCRQNSTGALGAFLSPIVIGNMHMYCFPVVYERLMVFPTGGAQLSRVRNPRLLGFVLAELASACQKWKDPSDECIHGVSSHRHLVPVYGVTRPRVI